MFAARSDTTGMCGPICSNVSHKGDRFEKLVLAQAAAWTCHCPSGVAHSVTKANDAVARRGKRATRTKKCAVREKRNRHILTSTPPPPTPPTPSPTTPTRPAYVEFKNNNETKTPQNRPSLLCRVRRHGKHKGQPAEGYHLLLVENPSLAHMPTKSGR